MDADTIGINRFAPIGMLSAAISSALSGPMNPSIKNLRAVIAVIDGVLGFEKDFFGPDAYNQRGGIEIFKGYRSAAAGAMSVKKRERHDFLVKSNVHLIKMMMDKYDGMVRSEMAKMDKHERAAAQLAIDLVVGKKEKPKLRVIR